MAIREFKYTVTPDSMAGSTVSKGGVQGERNATKLIFEISASLQNKLSALVAEGDNKSFYYRFDCYDGAGGMYSTAPVEFDPSNETEFSHLIAKRQTEFGGTIQVYFVITLVNGKNTEDTADDTTELELYSYSVKLMLKALPNGAETEGEDYESITTLAMSVKQNAEAVAEANAKMQAVLRGTWKFDGGNASNKTEFTVSDEIKDGGTNLVRSGAIKDYVENEIETYNSDTVNPQITKLESGYDEQATEISGIKNSIVGMADYIVEQGTAGIWVYRKWKSGISECWGRISDIYNGTSGSTGEGSIYDYQERTVEFPGDLFTDTPLITATIIDIGSGIATAEVNYDVTSASSCKVTAWGVSTAFGAINVYAIGKYKISEVAE